MNSAPGKALPSYDLPFVLGYSSPGALARALQRSDGFTLGLSSGFCIFLCIEIGLSGEGPYSRVGIGFAYDTPGIVFDNKSPECGSNETVTYVSIGVGPAQASFGGVSAGSSSSWESDIGLGVGLPDGGATPRLKGIQLGGGVKQEWISC